MTIADQSQLPPCDYRKVVDGQQSIICQHSRVRVNKGQVSSEICLHCSVRLLPSIPIEAHQRPSTPRQQTPALSKRAWNLAIAVKDFVADGCRTLSSEQYSERLAICDGCEFRNENYCSKCGCRLAIKARGRTFACPVGKWPTISKCG